MSPTRLSTLSLPPTDGRWQQLGGLVAVAMDERGCTSFSIGKISRWAAKMRDGRWHSPFITPTQAAVLNGGPTPALLHKMTRRQQLKWWGALIRTAEHVALTQGKEAEGPNTSAALALAHRFVRLLAQNGSARPSARFKDCAVVGSGPDLRCAAHLHWRRRGLTAEASARPNRGAEIDGHDAIFRANSFQLNLGSRLRVMQEAGSWGRLDQAAAEAYHVRMGNRVLPRHWLNASIAGQRTTHRVNCLFHSHAVPASRAENCIVPRGWWTQPWGRERFNNQPHPCCDTNQVRPSPLYLLCVQY